MGTTKLFNKRIFLRLFLPVLVVSLVAPAALTIRTDALSGSEWQAGRIIDDGVFYDGGAMSSDQIQAFLNAKVPNCDTNGQQSKSYYYNGSTGRVNNSSDSWVTTTRAVYGQRYDQHFGTNYGTAPYVCMRDYYQNTPDRSAESGLCSYYTGGTKTASQIIKDVAQACGVNPQVLLVLLQKEQSLVTDDWPWDRQFDKATGFACPDTPNGCDPAYAGYFYQVYAAARQFKKYQRDYNKYNYLAGRNNNIYYQADNLNTSENEHQSCWYSNVYIGNQATAGLYIYTPYQPNRAALDNLYGSGDKCSAYGNRNFWRLFNDWFGSTQSPDYSARATSQSPAPYLKQGEAVGLYARFKNVGNRPWYDDMSAYSAGQRPVRLGTDLPLNRDSKFASGWTYSHRPAINFSVVYDSNGAVKPGAHIAQPGESVEFWFEYKAPHALATGTYVEGFRPIIEGYGPMNDTGSYFTVNVTPATYTAQFYDQSPSVDVTQFQRGSAYIRYKNTGNITWHDDTSSPGSGQLSIHLATDYPLNRTSVLSNAWPYPYRAAVNFGSVYEANGTTLASDQHRVRPGQIVKFNFDIFATNWAKPGFYGEALRPIVQGLGPMNDTGTWMGVNLRQANYQASFAGQSEFPTLQKGQSADVFLKYKNNGNVAWYDDTSAGPAGMHPVRLGTDYQINRNSAFGSTWNWAHRPGVNFSTVYEADGTTLAANQHVAQTGQVVQFSFKLSAPASQAAGSYAEAFRPIVEGYGPMNDVGTWLGVTVTN